MFGIVTKAVRQTKEAREYAQIALARQLGAQAQSLSLMVNPKHEAAFLLAIQSMRLMPSGEAAQILLDSPLAHQVSLMSFDGHVYAVAFSPDGKNVAAGSDDHTVRVWEALTGKETTRFLHDGTVSFVRFSPNGKYLVSSTGFEENSVHVWEVDSGKEIVHLKYDSSLNYVSTIAISPDGKYMIPVVGYDNTFAVLELATGKEIRRFAHDEAAIDGVAFVAFSSSGRYIVSAGGSDNTVRVWDVSTGREIARMTHSTGVWSATFSPDENLVVSITDTTARVWDAFTGREVAHMTHDGYAYRAVFSPDGKYIASGGYDGTVRIWEATTGKEVTRMAFENHLVFIAYSPDGKYILTEGGGNVVPLVQVWETRTGKEIARTRGDVRSMTFSPDSRFIASANFDGTARVWQYLPEDLIAGACLFAPRNLTQAEWRQYIGDALPYQTVCPNLPIELTPAPLINTTPTAYPSSTPSL